MLRLFYEGANPKPQEWYKREEGWDGKQCKTQGGAAGWPQNYTIGYSKIGKSKSQVFRAQAGLGESEEMHWLCPIQMSNKFKKYRVLHAAAAKSLQSCPTLCDPIDGSPPGSPVPGILQARTLEWVAISFSNAWKWKVKVKTLCCARLLATPWTAAFQAPPSMGFSRQEYWSWVPLPSPFLRLCATKLKAIQTKIWR